MITYLKTLLFELQEQAEVKRRFYPNIRFRQVDQALRRAYRGINPYRISKVFFLKAGASDPHQYGETPLTTMAQIVRECDLRPKDTILEMGAGRGRVALFLAEYVGCKVIAYEQNPFFVEKLVHSPNLKIICQDMHTARLCEATVIFLYGTMLNDKEIEHLCERLPKGAKVITVSYPLSDYSQNYAVAKTFVGRFPWGKTSIYLNSPRFDSNQSPMLTIS